MKFGKLSGILFVAILALASCKKEGPLTPTNGIYRGVFSRILSGGDTSGTGVVFLAMQESDSIFIMSGDTISNVPFSSKGTFKLTPGKIEFINTASLLEYTEDPFNDRFFALDSIYDYEFSDTAFYFQLDLDTVKYDYNLVRV